MGDLFSNSDDKNPHPHFRSRGLPALDLAIAEAAYTAGEEGCALHDFMAATGRDKVTVSPRMAPMVKDGILRKGTAALKREGPTGQKISVWFYDAERDHP